MAAALVALLAVPSVTPAADDASSPPDSERRLIERRRARVAELPPPPEPPNVDAPAYNPIDQFIAARWAEAGLEPQPELCDDTTFLRRAYLDLIGVIPTLVETNRFLASRTSRQKREQLVDRLLERNADYAAHWTTFWEDALASQTVESQGGILTRGDYRAWLLASFERNRPYDVMVAELIDPTMPGRRPPGSKEVLGTNYAIDYVRNEDHTATLQTAADVAQVFLGTSMKCAGCHDHFENDEWPQERFLAFAGMFAPADLEKIRCESQTGQFVPARFPFDLPGTTGEVPADVTGRLHLAAAEITDPANPRFARAIVNRLWKRYFGLGLFEPADDFRLDTPPSHPELLDWLAYDFLAHGCDLKHTIRLILTSRTYQLRYDPAWADRYSAGADNPPRYFRSPGLRRLTAEQFLDSVRVAASGEFDPQGRTFLGVRTTALSRVLGRPASRNEISTSRPDDVAVVQSLELLNGRELHEMIYDRATFEVDGRRPNVRRLVDNLFRAVLSRRASLEERNAGRAYLEGADSPAEGMQDLLWALVCSPEFQYIK